MASCYNCKVAFFHLEVFEVFNLIENEMKRQKKFSITENGAIGLKTSGSMLVDINYQVSSLRNADEKEIQMRFDMAFWEDKELALKWLFFARDIREGMGERRLFRICYKRLADLDYDAFCKNLSNIPEYGRWDDLVSLIGISEATDKYIIDIIKNQLYTDLDNLSQNKPISLLGKWMPSENTSSKTTKQLAKKVRNLLEMSSREYRLMLSKLRKYSNVVEVQMCGNKWSEIDYEKVPSLANLQYKDSFLRHDKERRIKYLGAVQKGTKKINMSVATPVDIVSKYYGGYRWVKDYDETLELAWKNLKDIIISDTLVVADGSGSMTAPVGDKVTALDVAHSLAIYTSEHNSNPYKNKYITFSETPQFVDFSDCDTLHDKIKVAQQHCEVANTNIEAVFKLIFDIAIKNEVPAEGMIKNILIISDMEFDRAQSYEISQPLFEQIQNNYTQAGYKLPKLIFWNVNSRTKTIPLVENEMGVMLLSGFSQNVLKMVMSNKYDPYAVLREVLESKRY